VNDARVRIGLVGLGRMGVNHLRVLSLLKGAEIAFIYDVDRKKAKRLAQQNAVPCSEDFEAGLASADAIVIASPTVTHADYISRSARVVRNIFVEKPLTDTAESSEQIAEIARRLGLDIQVGFIERFNPAVQQLRNVLDRSTGIATLDFARTNKISARITDVDVITDLMVHDIDLALYLNGPVTEVAAHGLLQGRMIALASAVLTHANGRLSRILASRMTDKKMRIIQATCNDMFVECDLLRKEISITRQSEVIQPEGEPYTIISTEERLEVPPQEALLFELQAFLRSCQGFREQRPDVCAGVEAMRVCAAVQKAILPDTIGQ
jgi:predicted dehydrogenase